jgi:hypothetical protein
MGSTITEKIIAAHCGKGEVKPGQLVNASVDLVMINDLMGAMTFNSGARAAALTSLKLEAEGPIRRRGDLSEVLAVKRNRPLPYVRSHRLERNQPNTAAHGVAHLDELHGRASGHIQCDTEGHWHLVGAVRSATSGSLAHRDRGWSGRLGDARRYRWQWVARG